MGVKAALKRQGRVRRVLAIAYAVERCIAAAVLAALLMACLYVRAPWRIEAVIALLLANVVFMPWRWRLFFDVVTIAVFGVVAAWVVGALEEVRRESRGPSLAGQERGEIYYGRNGHDPGWRPYSFDEAVARAEAARAIVPQENAAAVYGRLFAAYDAEDFDRGLVEADAEGQTLMRGWRDAEFPGVKRWLEDHAEGLGMLYEAGQMPQCRFPLASTQLERDAQMLRTNLAKRWGLVLVRAIYNDLGEGRTAAAMEKIGVLRRMADHLYQQKMLFDMPRGLQLERLAYNAMTWLIVEGEPSEEDLETVEGWMRGMQVTLEADWAEVFEHEKLYIKHIAGLFYEINEAGDVRCSRNSILAINEQFRMGLHVVRRMEHTPRVTALFLWFTIPHRPEKTGRVIDQIFGRYFATMLRPGGVAALQRRAEDPDLNYKGIIELAAWRTVNWLYPHRHQWSQRLACRNATLVLVALKRHHRRAGQWPESLEAAGALGEIAADPLSGGAFVYRRQGEGFVLYSTGDNGVDDAGRNNPRDGSDDVWIWPARVAMLGPGLDPE
jgi:hypothetical protein